MSPDVRRARDYAVKAHGDQRYGEHPYEVHLDAVAAHLEDHGETAQIVGYLHDVVEDTARTTEDIATEFGALVATCVGILSDADGENRKDRKKATYAKMSRVEGDAQLALVVKAADRLANLEACLADAHTRLLGVYVGEAEAFRGAVYREGLCEGLWHRLEAALEDARAALED